MSCGGCKRLDNNPCSISSINTSGEGGITLIDSNNNGNVILNELVSTDSSVNITNLNNGEINLQATAGPINPNPTLILYQVNDTSTGSGNIISKIGSADETGNVTCSSGEVQINTANLNLPNIPNTIQTNQLYYNSSTHSVTYGILPNNPNSTLINYQVADTSTGSGNIISKIGGGNETYTVICNNTSIELKGIPNSFPVNNKNLLYYDNVTGIISYDTVANNTNILYQVADTSIHGPGNIITNIGSGTEGAVILCSDSPSTIELFAPNINFLGNSTFTISTLTNNVTTNQLYYNNVTGAVTYGVLPTNPNSTLINNQILDTVIGGNNITKIQNA